MTSRNFLAGGLLVIFATCVIAGERFWIATDPVANLPPTAQIERVLRMTTSISFEDVPLEEAVRFLADRHQIEIWLDKAVLTDEGIPADIQVSLAVAEISLDSALHLLLHGLGLTYVVENEVLKITSKAKADESFVTRVYPVRDLIDNGDGSDDYLTLMQALQQTTSGKWMAIDQEGGDISPVGNARSLVIRQTQKVHREIEGILAALRRSKQMQGLGGTSILPERTDANDPLEPIHRRTYSSPRVSPAATSWQQPRLHSAE